jgi:hypothetical protein
LPPQRDKSKTSATQLGLLLPEAQPLAELCE